MSMLFISHDLGLVGEIADHVVVMRHGTCASRARWRASSPRPQDAYTKALLACRPSLEQQPGAADGHRRPHRRRRRAQAGSRPRPRPRTRHAPVVLEVRSLAKSFWLRQGVFGKREFKAVQGVSFQLRSGHTLGVVGESGSGKTTMGLTLLRLHEPTARRGDLRRPQPAEAERRASARRCAGASRSCSRTRTPALNPRFTIGQTLVEPMTIHGIGARPGANASSAHARCSDKVGLDGRAFGKYPHEFSGGQRQRVAIARCLTLEPRGAGAGRGGDARSTCRCRRRC